jgi:hypothetical protein
LRIFGCNKIFLQASDGFDKVFQQQYTHAWSVKNTAASRSLDAVDFLDHLGQGADQLPVDRPVDRGVRPPRTIAIVGEKTPLTIDWLEDLTKAIAHTDGLTLVNIPRLTNDRLAKEIKLALECQPDMTIGLGEWQSMLRQFKLLEYGPEVAFLFTYLDLSELTVAESYEQPGCAECWVYDQWFGHMPWAPEMPYNGQLDWSNRSRYPDRYNDAAAILNGADRRQLRYMGSASDFTSRSV